QHESDAVHHPGDFKVREGLPESPRRLEDASAGKKLPTSHRSQSEADWAYAKRALARGDNPEQIIQRIADYRADDKADPGYYARHTVEKALRQSGRVTDDSVQTPQDIEKPVLQRER